MPMTVYKLFSSTAGDSTASLDIQMDGTIKSIHMTGSGEAMDALNDRWDAEVSFLSSNSFSTNDTRGSLMIIQSNIELLTQGGANGCVNAQISSLDVPVAAGERVHLHINIGGGTTASAVHAFLFVEDKGIQRVPGRRR